MAKKIKLSDAAKDLNVPAQELIDFFTEKGDNKKKTGSSLTEEEMNSVLEHYTKDRYSVSSLNDYFNSKNDPRPAKEETAVKEEKKVSAAKKPAEKKAAEEPKKDEKKVAAAAAPAPVKKAEKPVEPKKEEKPQTAAPAKAEEKPADK